MDREVFENLSPNERAEIHYANGMELNKQGASDAALTEFRRAVIANSEHAKAQFEIGMLCKVKAETEPIFLRYAFDAFRSASHLDLNNEAAHNNYIMVAQKYGRLDDLVKEYDNFVKHNPENPLLEKYKKNIVTISMALLPDRVNISSGQTKSLRKAIFIISIILLVLGLGLLFAPALLLKGKSHDVIRQLFWGGTFCSIFGAIGLFTVSRLK